MSGKGGAPRPFDVDQETYGSNWARTFGKKNAEPEEKKEVDEQQSEQERTGTPGQG
jgi:hypothetical protein